MKDKILTIDVGTGSTRAAIVRIDGAMIGFAQREYEQTTPRAGWSEQAPSLWWQAACDCIREVLYRYHSAQFWKGWPLHPGAIFGSCRSAGSIRNK